MFKRTLLATIVAAFALPALAEDAPQAKDKEQVKEQAKPQARQRDQIYGSQMMSDEERQAYRNKMRAAKTQEEREQIRREHHDEMVKRAKDKGMKLPDEPPMMGGGMGSGMGSGGGMGPGGGGMSPGGGMGGGGMGRGR